MADVEPVKITCPKCLRTSHNPTDVAEGYCGACHDWTGAPMGTDPTARTRDRLLVAGRCPMGCGNTLFVGSGGYVTCSHLECPRPDAVAALLEDREVEREDAEEKYAVQTAIADVVTLAGELAARARASGQVGAEVWAAGLEWFARRIHGGQRSVIAQEEFDRQFGGAE